MERHEVPAARADFAECSRRARQAGFVRLVFKAEHNLGYLSFVAGRMPEALAVMESAAAILPGAPAAHGAAGPRAGAARGGAGGCRRRRPPGGGRAAVRGAAPAARRRRVRARSGRVRDAARRPCWLARDFARSAERRFRRRGDDAWVVRSTLLALQAHGPGVRGRPAGPAHASRPDGLPWPAAPRGSRRCASIPAARSGRRVRRTSASSRTWHAVRSPTRWACSRRWGRCGTATPSRSVCTAAGSAPCSPSRPATASAPGATSGRVSGTSVRGARFRLARPADGRGGARDGPGGPRRVPRRRHRPPGRGARRGGAGALGDRRDAWVNPPSDPGLGGAARGAARAHRHQPRDPSARGERPAARACGARGPAAQARDPRAVVARARSGGGRPGGPDGRGATAPA